MWQDRILSKLLSSLTLSRIHDSELKVPADEDALTTAELLSASPTRSSPRQNDFKAGDYTDRKPAISSLRRNLQRAYLERLSRLAMGQTSAPEDCETVAFVELKDLKGRIDTMLGGDFQLDDYSRAHLDRVVGEDRQGARRDDASPCAANAVLRRPDIVHSRGRVWPCLAAGRRLCSEPRRTGHIW